MATTLTHEAAPEEGGVPPEQAGGGFRSRVVVFLGMILAFPLLVVVAYFATRSVLPGLSALDAAVPQGSSTLTVVQSFNDTSLQQVTGQLFPSLNSQSLETPLLVNLSPIDLVGLLLFATAAILVLVVWRGLKSRRGRTAPFEDPGDFLEGNRRRLAAILDAAVARLNTGSSYRETVIQCYKMISELLEERSAVDGKVLTPREFRARVSEKLMVEPSSLAQATELFEVARYSDQEITMEQSQEAVTCLSNLSTSLKEPTLSSGGVK